MKIMNGDGVLAYPQRIGKSKTIVKVAGHPRSMYNEIVERVLNVPGSILVSGIISQSWRLGLYAIYMGN